MNQGKKYIVFSIVLILLGANQAFSQKRKVDKADDKFVQYRYLDARKIYEKVIDKGFESEEVYERLANTYYFNASYAEAAKWYKRLFDYSSDYDKTDILLRYSQSLKAIGKDQEAERVYLEYLENSGRKDSRILEDYLERIAFNSDRYDFGVLEELYDEEQITYGKTVVDSELWYSSTFDKPNSFLNTRDAWSGLSFVSLFKVPIDSENNITGEPKRVKNTFKERFHISSPVFTKDGATAYFTRSNTSKTQRGEDVVLKIYRSSLKDNVWQKPEELSINGEAFSTAHPALSPEEDKLYFSSDRDGGFGNSDLYVVAINEDGSLGEVQNLGDKINTDGREVFPFVSEENELYFSSDGHFGLGGLDVFYVKIEDDGEFGPVINVGEPVNSPADDFAFGLNSETKYGFVSSNRSDSDSLFVKDNIYSFKENTSIRYQAVIEGVVTEKYTDKPIEEASVLLVDLDGKEYAEVYTDDQGHYKVKTNMFDTYQLRASKEGYDSDEKVSEANLEHQIIDFVLQNNEITTGTDLAKLLNIPMIHFDFDKHAIRSDARVELEKLIAVLEEYPDLRINIRSHTDSRGTHAYNQKLSERRAQSTYDYLVKAGIAADRMEYEGLGETELLNECADNVPCSAAKHQENRRSEFIVIE